MPLTGIVYGCASSAWVLLRNVSAQPRCVGTNGSMHKNAAVCANAGSKSERKTQNAPSNREKQRQRIESWSLPTPSTLQYFATLMGCLGLAPWTKPSGSRLRSWLRSKTKRQKKKANRSFRELRERFQSRVSRNGATLRHREAVAVRPQKKFKKRNPKFHIAEVN